MVIYSLAFWKAVSYLGAGVIGLLVYFGHLPEAWLYGDAVILMATLAVLNFFGVVPELREKELL
jgi:hypothetical protein